jgi:heterotetrameric sarcosine oxidase beta subunit
MSLDIKYFVTRNLESRYLGRIASMRYSIFNLFRQALRNHREWQPAWRDATPKEQYDVIVVGGGAHGLATAYYLAKVHNIKRVALLEKSWIGSGNAGRNTTIIRSNYLLPGNLPFYEHSMRLWEGLERELNYNVMVSQRGVLNLYHSDAQRDAFARRGNAMRLHGVDAELLDAAEVRRMAPFLDFDNFPGLRQRALSDPRRTDATARRHGAARCRSLGVCTSRQRSRRGHHSELRSHRIHSLRGSHCRRRNLSR